MRSLVKGTPLGACTFYHPELDALRFFAFSGVFLYHTLPTDPNIYLVHRLLPPAGAKLLASVASSGRYGVDLFFVLSAYLITELLLRERDLSGRIGLKNFYLRRTLRIWPLYYLVVLAAAAFSYLGWQEGLSPSQALVFAVFGANWYMVFSHVPASIATPLWSVSVEEQFYFSWPILLKIAAPRMRKWVLVSFFVLANLGRGMAVFLGAGTDALWSNTFLRLDPICAGAALALLLRRFSLPDFSLAVRCALLAGFGLLAVLVGSLAGPTGKPDAAASLIAFPAATISSVLLFFSFFCNDAHAPWPRFIIYLGKISYGLYAYHLLCLLAMRNLMRSHLNTLAGFGLYWCGSLLLTVLVSALSYRFLEGPFLQMKRRFTVVESRPV